MPQWQDVKTAVEQGKVHAAQGYSSQGCWPGRQKAKGKCLKETGKKVFCQCYKLMALISISKDTGFRVKLRQYQTVQLAVTVVIKVHTGVCTGAQ